MGKSVADIRKDIMAAGWHGPLSRRISTRRGMCWTECTARAWGGGRRIPKSDEFCESVPPAQLRVKEHELQVLSADQPCADKSSVQFCAG